MARIPAEAGIETARTGNLRAKGVVIVQPRIALAAVIANGAAASAAVDLGGATLLGVQMPAAWTAAGLHLLASADGVTYGPVSDKSGTPYAVAVDALEVVALDKEVTRPFRYVKIGSGTTAVPVNQGAARTLTLIVG